MGSFDNLDLAVRQKRIDSAEPVSSSFDALDKASGIQPEKSIEPTEVKLHETGYFASDYDPDQAADLLKKQATLGVPPMIAKDDKEIDKAAQAVYLNLPAFARKAPGVAKWLSSSPEVLAAVRPDMTHFEKFETDHYEYDFWSSFGKNFVSNVFSRSADLADLPNLAASQTMAAQDVALPSLVKTVRGLKSPINVPDIGLPADKKKLGEPNIYGFGPNQSELLAPLGTTPDQVSLGVLKEAVSYNPVAKYLQNKAEQWKIPDKELRSLSLQLEEAIERDDWGRAVGLTAIAMSGQAPQFALLFLGTPGALALSATSGVQGMREGLAKDDATLGQVAAHAGISAAAEYGFEKYLGTLTYLDKIPEIVRNKWGKEGFKKFAASVGLQAIKNTQIEGLEEVGTGIVQRLSARMTGIDSKPFDIDAEVRAAFDDYILGALSGGTLGSLTSSVKVAQEKASIKRTKDFYKSFGDSIQAMKIREKLPSLLRDGVNAAVKNGPVNHVIVETEALEKVLGDELPGFLAKTGLTESFDSAKKSTGELSVPMGDWAENIAIVPETHSALSKHIKFNVDDLTENQLFQNDVREAALNARQREEETPKIPEDETVFKDPNRLREFLPNKQVAQAMADILRSVQPEVDQATTPGVESPTQQKIRAVEELIPSLPDSKDVRFEQAVSDFENQLRASGRPEHLVLTDSAIYRAGFEAAAGADDVHPMDIIDNARQVVIQGGSSGTQTGQQFGSPGGGLGQSPLATPLRGIPKSSPGPSQRIRAESYRYAQSKGLPVRQQLAYAKADPERGARIAAEYDKLKHDPQNPEVKAAYRALIDETVEQFQIVKQMGIRVEMIKPGQPNPYPNGSPQMIEDVEKNQHLWFFPTDQGFGTINETDQHPLLEPTNEYVDGRQLVANDVFRIVHDIFGHAKEGVGFGPTGEENAWNAHVRMYSPLAARAMTTETRGQNSWVNFGPFGEQNRKDPVNTTYADQKAGLLPEWVVTEGMAEDTDSDTPEANILFQNILDFTDALKKKKAKEAEEKFFKAVDSVEAQKEDKELQEWAKKAKASYWKDLSEKMLNKLASFHSTAGKTEDLRKLLDEAQNPNSGPYVLISNPFSEEKGRSVLPVPNYKAKPTGVIGSRRITFNFNESDESLIDPLRWPDRNTEATRKLIMAHNEAGIPLTINTSSDMVGHDDYIEIMPRDTTVNMYLLPDTDLSVSHALFPGSPSRKRQLKAVDHLRTNGIKVNVIQPTLDDVVKAAGGMKRVKAMLGVKNKTDLAGALRGKKLKLVGAAQEGQTLYQGGSISSFLSGKYKNMSTDQLIDEHNSNVDKEEAAWTALVDGTKNVVTWGPKGTVRDLLAFQPVESIEKDFFQTVMVNQRRFDDSIKKLFLNYSSAAKFMVASKNELKSRDEGLTFYQGENDRRKFNIQLTPEQIAKMTKEEMVDHMNKAIAATMSIVEPTMEAMRKQARADIQGFNIDNVRAMVEDAQDPEFKSVGAMDLDGLKTVNDTFGFANGSKLLSAFSDYLTQKQGDGSKFRFYRIGGDEFAFLFKGSPAEAEAFAAELKKDALENIEFYINHDPLGLYHYKGVAFSYATQARTEKPVFDPTGANADTDVGFLLEDENKGGPVKLQAKERLKSGDKEARAVPGLESRRVRRVEPGSEEWQSVLNSVPDRRGKTDLDQSADQGKRGKIAFLDTKALISILNRADASTIPHELLHYFTELLMDRADRLRAKDPATLTIKQKNIIKDADALLKLAGVENRKQLWDKNPNDLDAQGNPKAFHEKIAEAGERFVMLGEAPSAALRRVFARLSRWMTKIYGIVRNDPSLQMDADARAAFERMFATQQEIDAMKQSVNIDLFDDPESQGVSNQDAERLTKLMEDARTEAYRILENELAEEDKARRSEAWEKEREMVRADIEKQVKARKEYAAMAMIRGTQPDGSEGPPMYMDRDQLEDIVGQERMKRLPKPYIYRKEGGIDPEVVAQTTGYGSVDEMILALENLIPEDVLIDQLTEQKMLEIHGDMILDGKIQQEAITALHNEKRSEQLRFELEWMAKEHFPKFKNLTDRVSRRLPRQNELRLEAEKQIQRQRVRDSKPAQYLRAEQNSAREAKKAYWKGDIARAWDHKKQELYNHELYLAAVKAEKSAQKMVDYFRSFDRASVWAELGKAGEQYQLQIGSLLERFSFKRQSLKAVDKAKSLADWIEAQTKDGLEPNISAKMKDEAFRKNYVEMTYEELSELHDAVKNIQTLAKLKTKLLSKQYNRTIQETAQEIHAAAAAHHKLSREPKDVTPGFKDKLLLGKEKFVASHTRMEFFFKALDGYQDYGPIWQALFKPFADAENDEETRKKVIVQKWEEIWSPYSLKEKRAMQKKKFYPGLKSRVNTGNLTKMNLIVAALNIGNSYNKEALLESYGWTEEQLMAVLQQELDARDLKVINQIWELIDTLWPDAKALELEVTGIAPPKVEAEPFKIGTVEMRGGYYPIVFDKSQSVRQAELDSAAAIQEAFGGSFGARAMTRHGHLIARKGTGGKPILLDLSGAMNHMTQVVHDITHRRAVIDVNRLIRHELVKDAIIGVAGQEMYKQMNPWLHNIAGDQLSQMAQTYVDNVASLLRKNAVTMGLGFNVTSALVQTASMPITFKEIGAKYSFRGLIEVFKNPAKIPEVWRFVAERSIMMETRIKNLDRDVRDAHKRLQLEGSSIDSYTKNVQGAALYFIGFMDRLVSVPAWMGGYLKALEGHVDNIEAGNEAKAIAFADSVVRMSQTAGSAKDLSAIQRGSNLTKLFTMYYGQMSIIYNQFQSIVGKYKNTGDFKEFMKSTMLVWFAQVAMEQMLRGLFFGDDDDKFKEFAYKLFEFPLGTVIMLRDVVSAYDWARKTGQVRFNTPALDALEKIITGGLRATGTVGGQGWSDYDVKSAVDAVGYATGMPTRAAYKYLNKVHDWLSE